MKYIWSGFWNHPIFDQPVLHCTVQKTLSKFDQFSETIKFLTTLYYTVRCKKTWSIFDQVSETIQFLTTLYYTVRCKKREVNLISFPKPSNFWPPCITLYGAKNVKYIWLGFWNHPIFDQPVLHCTVQKTLSKFDQFSETIQFLTTLYYTVRCRKHEVYLIRFPKPSNFWPPYITLYGAKNVKYIWLGFWNHPPCKVKQNMSAVNQDS